MQKFYLLFKRGCPKKQHTMGCLVKSMPQWYATCASISISFDFSNPDWLSKLTRIFRNVTVNSLTYEAKRKEVYINVQIKLYNIPVGYIIFVLYKVNSQLCNPHDQPYLPCKLWYLFIWRVLSSVHFENSCISYWVDLPFPLYSLFDRSLLSTFLKV